jgi:thiol-disulfide isomerase/thioredoxin
VTLPVLQTDAAVAAGVAELSLADLQGRVVIVNFWASWCGPCRLEQPDLNQVHALLPDSEVVLVGVNIEDTAANALAHLIEFDVAYLSLFDPVNALAGRFSGIGARTIPTTILLHPEGRVAARLLGLTDTREIAALAGAVVGG